MDPVHDIGSQFEIGCGDDGNGNVVITVMPSSSCTGFAWITVPCDYDWKKEGQHSRDLSDNADNGDKTIEPYHDDTPLVRGPVSSSWMIENWNVFKKNPGVGGLTLMSDATPAAGARFRLYGPTKTTSEPQSPMRMVSTCSTTSILENRQRSS